MRSPSFCNLTNRFSKEQFDAKKLCNLQGQGLQGTPDIGDNHLSPKKVATLRQTQSWYMNNLYKAQWIRCTHKYANIPSVQKEGGFISRGTQEMRCRWTLKNFQSFYRTRLWSRVMSDWVNYNVIHFGYEGRG